MSRCSSKCASLGCPPRRRVLRKSIIYLAKRIPRKAILTVQSAYRGEQFFTLQSAYRGKQFSPCGGAYRGKQFSPCRARTAEINALPCRARPGCPFRPLRVVRAPTGCHSRRSYSLRHALNTSGSDVFKLLAKSMGWKINFVALIRAQKSKEMWYTVYHNNFTVGTQIWYLYFFTFYHNVTKYGIPQ